MSECGHCRDCKRWEPITPPTWGTCERFTMGNAALGLPMYPGALAFLQVNRRTSGAELLTAETFGCVQFETREEGNDAPNS